MSTRALRLIISLFWLFPSHISFNPSHHSSNSEGGTCVHGRGYVLFDAISFSVGIVTTNLKVLTVFAYRSAVKDCKKKKKKYLSAICTSDFI